jgi:hypothetical protein
MESFAKERDEAVPDVLVRAWEHALAKWDDPARHDEVIRLVTANDAYAWAASRYRTRADEIGTRQLERVRKAAEVTMMSSAAERPEKQATTYRATRLMMVALILIVVGGLIYAMWAKDRGPQPVDPNTVTPTSK